MILTSFISIILIFFFFCGGGGGGGGGCTDSAPLDMDWIACIILLQESNMPYFYFFNLLGHCPYLVRVDNMPYFYFFKLLGHCPYLVVNHNQDTLSFHSALHILSRLKL